MLLVCLRSAAIGGNLVLQRATGAEWKLTYARGTVVLFPSRMLHRAELVERGTKELLKFDVLSSEELWFVRAKEPSGRKQPQLVADGAMKRLQALHAKARFERASSVQGPLSTALVTVGELRDAVLLLQTGRTPEPSCPH